jgi:hemerythrin superfamily protein
MATRDQTARPIGKSHTKGMDAITLLEQDHRKVEGYFEEYEKAKSEEKKSELASQIYTALTVHTQLEEELFYPAARKATGDDDLLDEATVEHASAKQLIAEIKAMSVGDEPTARKAEPMGGYA